MEETDGEKLIEKYVTKTKEKPRKIAHVGGPFPKKDTIEEKYGELNKKGLHDLRDN